MKTSYHTHTTISDGKVKPKELIKYAIKKKFKVLALTDHYTHPKGFREWGEKFYSQEDYNKLVKLKKQYSKKIKILIGAEFDWLEGYEKWTKQETTKRKYDLKLVAIHFIEIGKEHYPIDHSKELFGEMIQKINGIKKLVKKYYRNQRNAIKTKKFDTIAHMDLIKFWNKNNEYFSENDEWYKKEINKTLKLAKKYKIILDVNLSGLKTPCKQIYPSPWIIKKAKQMNIKTRIGTDAHKKGQLDYNEKTISKIINQKT